jgi:hypothetical protein
MRSFKALWRLAVSRREDRHDTREAVEPPLPGREPLALDHNDKTAALLNQDPPTRTLQ